MLHAASKLLWVYVAFNLMQSVQFFGLSDLQCLSWLKFFILRFPVVPLFRYSDNQTFGFAIVGMFTAIILLKFQNKDKYPTLRHSVLHAAFKFLWTHGAFKLLQCVRFRVHCGSMQGMLRIIMFSISFVALPRSLLRREPILGHTWLCCCFAKHGAGLKSTTMLRQH